jgi:hypothetical protein
MKKIALSLLLLALLTTEAYLGAAFLPMSWQLAIQRALPGSHDHSYITHPDLEGEIDQALRHHAGLRVIFYTILVLLLAGNTFLLVVVWRKLRSGRVAHPSP